MAITFPRGGPSGGRSSVPSSGLMWPAATEAASISSSDIRLRTSRSPSSPRSISSWMLAACSSRPCAAAAARKSMIVSPCTAPRRGLSPSRYMTKRMSVSPVLGVPSPPGPLSGYPLGVGRGGDEPEDLPSPRRGGGAGGEGVAYPTVAGRSSECLSEERLVLLSVTASNLLVQIDADAGGIGHGDEAVTDDRAVDAGDHVVPEGHAHPMPLQRQEVGHGSADVGAGDRADRARDAVRGDGDVLRVRHVGDLAALQQPAGLLEVGRGNAQCSSLEGLPEAEAHVIVLATGDRRSC